MLDTIYITNKGFTVLREDSHKNHKFIIATLGYYPAAYVKILDQVSPWLASSWESFEFIKVHGGISYTGACYLKGKEDAGHWIGWDYNHMGDYNGSYPYNSFKNFEAKKWNVNEIYKEVKSVIDQVLIIKDYALWKLLTDNHN